MALRPAAAARRRHGARHVRHRAAVALSYVVTHAGKPQVPAANLGAPHENVEFTTSDGLRLKGWYVPSRNGAAVIAFAGRRDTQLRARMLVRHGYGVLLFDRRGEGESEGDPNLFGWQGERDVHGAVAFLQRRPDVDPQRIGAIGLSVGGEMLIEAAAESTALKAIVSEGASGRSVCDTVANPDTQVAESSIGMGVATVATALFTDNLPPATLRSLVPKIGNRCRVLHLRREGPAGGEAREHRLLRARARPEGDLGGAGRRAHERRPGAARRSTSAASSPSSTGRSWRVPTDRKSPGKSHRRARAPGAGALAVGVRIALPLTYSGP